MTSTPSGLGSIIGQDAAVRRLESALSQPVPAYLFVGPAGVGKRAAARAFAGELFAADTNEEDAARHRRLAAIEQHPDLVVVERTGPTITAEQLRNVVRSASLSPAETNVKVILLVDFHLVGDQTAMVLKAIEEPPPSTMFVVLATDVPPELVTIASRCVRIDFAPLSERTLAEMLMQEGFDEPTSVAAAGSASGDVERARLLAGDPAVRERLAAWRGVPARLDGTGHIVAVVAEELLGMIESAAGPLVARHSIELDDLEDRVARTGERGSGRKDMTDRHKRELRRHRAEEFRSGLSALLAIYRDMVAVGTADGGELMLAGDRVHEAIAALNRNPNERLMLQSLLVRLPPAR